MMIDPNQLYSVLQHSNLIQNLQDCLSIEAIQSVDEVQISLFNVLSLMIQLYSEGMKAVLPSFMQSIFDGILNEYWLIMEVIL